MDTTELTQHLRQRSTSVRRFGRLSIAGIVVIVFLIVTLFLFSGAKTFSVQTSYQPTFGSTAPTSDESDLKRQIATIKSNLDQLASRANMESDSTTVTAMTLSAVSATLVRVGAVVVAIFLVQILTNFARYQFQISDHLDAIADSLSVSTSVEEFKTYMQAMQPPSIGFSKTDGPNDKLLELVKELTKKLPSK